MRRLFIVGAGAFGREVLAWALDVPADQRDWDVAGFLDARTDMPASYRGSHRVMGDPADFQFQPDDCAVCAVGDPHKKLERCRNLVQRGVSFITLIHPSAVVGPDTTIGTGTIVCPMSVITCNATIGKFVTINIHSVVSHDALVGDGCTLSPHCVLTGGVRLGEGVFLGTNASVLPHANVGDYAVVGAGSVVLSKVSPRTTVMGVPARPIIAGDATPE